MSTQPKAHVVTNIAVVTQAMLQFIDTQYTEMVRTRNTYRIAESRKHYEQGFAAVKELDLLFGEPFPDRACDFIRSLDPVKWGVPEGLAQPAV